MVRRYSRISAQSFKNSACDATVDGLDDAFAQVEALDQYDEGDAIVRMSAHERTFACGRVDHEFTADDLPEQARFLAGDLLRAYASGVEIAEIWNEVTAHLDVLFSVKGKTAEGGRFFSARRTSGISGSHR